MNETFARRFLTDRRVGEWIRINDRWLEIVGVVGDVRTSGLRDEVKPVTYLPQSNTAIGIEIMHAVVRSNGIPPLLASTLRGAVNRVDTSVPLTTTRTMEEVLSASLAQTSFTMTLLAIAAAMALVLGSVGLYGVISYVVTQRTTEIGVRLALGAEPVNVRLMVLRQGLTMAFAGVAVGLLAAFASTRAMASLLFEVPAYDPATFALVAIALTAVSAAATYVPARRAAGIDPVRALREDWQ